ncbi:MAG: hypothetical protein QOJ89_3938 [bacterium]|jgi:hypothetical protein
MRAPVVLAALGVLAVAAPPASAAWRAQRLPSSPATASIDPPSIASNARGDTAVAWIARPRAFVAVRHAGAARFGRPIELRRFARPRVAVLSDGSVLIASQLGDRTVVGRRPCCPIVFAQRLAPGSRRPTPLRPVTTRGISVGGWALAAGLRGHAALVADVDGLALASSRGAGVFGPLTTQPLPPFGQPAIGFGGDGRGLALWSEGDYGSEQRLIGAPISRDGRLAKPRTLVTAPDPLSSSAFLDVRLGLDERSRVTALWLDEGQFFKTPSTIDMATGSVGRIGRPQVIGGGGPLPGGVRDPTLAVARNGRAIAAWRLFGAVEQNIVAIRRGPRSPFRLLPALPGDGYGARVAILPSGNAVVVSGFGSRARARLISPSGMFGRPRLLSGHPTALSVALSAAGRHITMAWGTKRGLRVETYTPSR